LLPRFRIVSSVKHMLPEEQTKELVLKNPVGDVSTVNIQVPHLLMLRNMADKEEKLTLEYCRGISLQYKVFSPFIKTGANSMSCGWAVVHNGRGAQQGGKGDYKQQNYVDQSYALDELTSVIIKDGGGIEITDDKVVAGVTEVKSLSCLHCEKIISFSSKAVVCKGCEIACYCDKKCAVGGWVNGHESMCGRIKDVVSENGEEYTTQEKAWTIFTDKEFLRTPGSEQKVSS
jgi:hypothetical protein